MMYFIDRPATWGPANRKCKELQDFVNRFRNTLIADDLSRDALVEELRKKVEDLNQAYPRTKPLAVHFNHHENFITCQPEKPSVDEYVFTIHLLPVRRTFRFSEQALLEKGGRQ